MQRSIRSTMAVLIVLALAATGGRAAAANLALRADSKLWLDGKSTVHEYHSNATRLEATFDEDASRWSTGAPGEVVEGFVREHGVRGLVVSVPVAGLRSGKDGLDKNMVKALRGADHPAIRFELSGYEISKAVKDGLTIDAKGRLRIAGVEHEMRIPVTATRDGDAIRLRGSVPLLMSQYGIKPPTMMMGTLRTADEVTVHFDLAIVAKDAVAIPTAGK